MLFRSHIEFGDRGEQRIELDIRHARVKEAAETFDKAKHFDLALVGPHHRPMDGRIQSRRIAPGGENSDPLYASSS